MAESLFVRVDEVCQMLAVSRAEAYRIIKRLNAELAAQGYIVMTGRVNRRYHYRSQNSQEYPQYSDARFSR